MSPEGRNAAMRPQILTPAKEIDMKTTPSLFVFEDGVLELTVDLEKIALMTKRADGSYWLRVVGGDSLNVAAAPGAAIRNAWVAYQGKFNPATDR